MHERLNTPGVDTALNDIYDEQKHMSNVIINITL